MFIARVSVRIEISVDLLKNECEQLYRMFELGKCSCLLNAFLLGLGYGGTQDKVTTSFFSVLQHILNET